MKHEWCVEKKLNGTTCRRIGMERHSCINSEVFDDDVVASSISFSFLRQVKCSAYCAIDLLFPLEYIWHENETKNEKDLARLYDANRKSTRLKFLDIDDSLHRSHDIVKIPTLHIPSNICRRVSGILYAVRIHVTVIRRVFAIHFRGQRRLAAPEREKCFMFTFPVCNWYNKLSLVWLKPNLN